MDLMKFCMRQLMGLAQLKKDPLMDWDKFVDGILTLRYGYQGVMVDKCVTYEQICSGLFETSNTLTVICFLRV